MTVENKDLDAFRERLDASLEFPCVYLFKFIVPREEQKAMVAVFDGAAVRLRPSRTGKYVSVSANLPVAHSGEVIEMYRRAAAIPGVHAL
ncbi:MAG: DUF493 domain-containing protein [Desulfovibrionaceae bacterium]